jgi:hypothetical protein
MAAGLAVRETATTDCRVRQHIRPMYHWRSAPQRRPSADSAGLTRRLYQVQASLLPGALISLLSEDEIGRTGGLFRRSRIYLRSPVGMKKWGLEGTDLAVRPRDNRQRGRLVPADRPNYFGNCCLASKNEIGSLFARRAIYLRKLALVSQIPFASVVWQITRIAAQRASFFSFEHCIR